VATMDAELTVAHLLFFYFFAAATITANKKQGGKKNLDHLIFC